MEFLKKNKIVTILAMIAIIALAYFGFASLSPSPTLSANDSGPSAKSQNLLMTLANLRTIQLDGSIFKNLTFVSLTDFSVTIPPPPSYGRTNPFAPAGVAAITATSTSQNKKITPKSLR